MPYSFFIPSPVSLKYGDTCWAYYSVTTLHSTISCFCTVRPTHCCRCLSSFAQLSYKCRCTTPTWTFWTCTLLPALPEEQEREEDAPSFLGLALSLSLKCPLDVLQTAWHGCGQKPRERPWDTCYRDRARLGIRLGKQALQTTEHKTKDSVRVHVCV